MIKLRAGSDSERERERVRRKSELYENQKVRIKESSVCEGIVY